MSAPLQQLLMCVLTKTLGIWHSLHLYRIMHCQNCHGPLSWAGWNEGEREEQQSKGAT